MRMVAEKGRTSVAPRGTTGTRYPRRTRQSSRTTSATARCAARHRKLAGQRLPLAPVRLAPAAVRKQCARLHRLDRPPYRAPAVAGAASVCGPQSEARRVEARRPQQRRAVLGTLRAASSRRRARAAGRARVASSLMHYSRRRCSRRPGTCWMACGLPCSGRRSVVGLSPRDPAHKRAEKAAEYNTEHAVDPRSTWCALYDNMKRQKALRAATACDTSVRSHFAGHGIGKAAV